MTGFVTIPVFCSFLISLWITLVNICRFLLYEVIWLDLFNEFRVTWHDKVIYKWLFCGWSIPLRKPTENFLYMLNRLIVLAVFLVLVSLVKTGDQFGDNTNCAVSVLLPPPWGFSSVHVLDLYYSLLHDFTTGSGVRVSFKSFNFSWKWFQIVQQTNIYRCMYCKWFNRLQHQLLAAGEF